MPTYVRRNGVFVDKKTGEPMKLPKWQHNTFPTPQLIKQMPDYQSPIDGKAITSRTARKEDLKRNGCVPYEPSLSPTKGKVRNPRYATQGRRLTES